MPNKILSGLLSYMLSFRLQEFCPEVINRLNQGHKRVSNRPLTIGVVSSIALMSYGSRLLESFSLSVVVKYF